MVVLNLTKDGLMKLLLIALTCLLLSCSTSTLPKNIRVSADWDVSGGEFTCKAIGAKPQSIHFTQAHDNAKISFEIKAKDIKSFTFLAKGDGGSVFRFVVADGITKYVAWNRANELKTSEVATSYYELREDSWIPVEITYKNKEILVSIDKEHDEEYVNLEEISYDRTKEEFFLEFTGGELSVRNIKLLSQ
jgi:hypothetical protein